MIFAVIYNNTFGIMVVLFAAKVASFCESDKEIFIFFFLGHK